MSESKYLLMNKGVVVAEIESKKVFGSEEFELTKQHHPYLPYGFQDANTWLINLKSFEYENPGYDFPAWRLNAMNNIKDLQIDDILGRSRVKIQGIDFHKPHSIRNREKNTERFSSFEEIMSAAEK